MPTFTRPPNDLHYDSQPTSRSKAGYLAQLVQYWKRALLARQLISELSRLDDHLLRDIGIQDRLDVARTGELYGLEVNPNGNVWHFSSPMWAQRRKQLPEVAAAMHSQFDAFDVAADALILATRQRAI